MISNSDAHEKVGDRNVFQLLNRNLGYLLCVAMLVYLLGMLTYGERFPFWEKAYSHIGTMRTVSGYPNTLALLVFGLGMLLSSWICYRSSKMRTSQFDNLCFIVCSAGYLLLMVPCDLFNAVHSIGGALVFGSLWLFSVIHLNEIHNEKPGYKFWLYHLILQGTVLPYAFLYAVKSPADQQVQKLAFIGLFLTLKLVMNERVRISNLE